MREHPIVRRVRRLVSTLPATATVTLPVAELVEWLEHDATEPAPSTDASTVTTWRERMWAAPDDVLLGVPEIAEALGRPVSWVYRRTGPSSDNRLPVARLAGEVVVRAEDLRRWVRANLEHDTAALRRVA